MTLWDWFIGPFAELADARAFLQRHGIKPLEEE